MIKFRTMLSDAAIAQIVTGSASVLSAAIGASAAGFWQYMKDRNQAKQEEEKRRKNSTELLRAHLRFLLVELEAPASLVSLEERLRTVVEYVPNCPWENPDSPIELAKRVRTLLQHSESLSASKDDKGRPAFTREHLDKWRPELVESLRQFLHSDPTYRGLIVGDTSDNK